MTLSHPIDQSGIQEVLISVRDLDEAAAPWLDIAGWKQLGADHDGTDLATFWSVPRSRIRQRVLHNPASARGFVRLVCFDGVPRRWIRSSAQPWESGGFFDLYLKVRDVRAAHDALQHCGWQAFADPVSYEFMGVSVTEIITRGPDGYVLCLMEIAGAAADDPYLAAAPFGQLFNAALTVAESDYIRSCEFFTKVLGWNTYFEGVNKSQPPGDNPIGLPRNLALGNGRKAAIFIDHATDRTGSLLVLTFEGLDVRDHAEHAMPPNLGLFSVRVAVSNPAAVAAGIVDRGGELITKPTIYDIPPYGPSIVFAVATPSNGRIEFFGPVAEMR